MPPTGTRTKPSEQTEAAPDTVRDETEESDISLEELLARDFKDDGGVRIVDSATGNDVKDGVSHLLSLREVALKQAATARRAQIRADEQTGLLAMNLLDMRASIIRPDTGLPDWSGGTKTYKDLASAVIDEASMPGEARGIVVNRLQRRATRMLGTYQAKRQNAKLDLGFSDDEIESLVSSGMKAVESEDESTQKLVQAVNAEYRVGDHADNEPYSPFEPTKAQQRNATTTRGERAASEGVKNLQSLKSHIPNIALDLVTEELIHVDQAIAQAALGAEPKYGKGRQVVVRNLQARIRILDYVAKTLSEASTSKEEDATFEKLMAL